MGGQVSPIWAIMYFAAFIVVIVFMMFNMVIAIIMKTYDEVASEVSVPSLLLSRLLMCGTLAISRLTSKLMRS